jgi:drug/metabolite transporter (DMT)-like permease
MAPIDYTRLVFAVLAGLLLFHEIPKPATLIGAAIVVASTLFISLREHQLSTRAATLAAQTPG